MGFSVRLSLIRRFFSDRRYLVILLTGFSSGLPLLLVGGTLRYWLADSNVTLATIGLFSLVSLPYALKFLWAPILDRAHLPLLTRRFGRRRSWGLLIQLCLALSLLWLARSPVETNLKVTAALAVLVAFLSASQDVVIDALRIEMLDPSEYAFGGAVTGVGYRIGMLAAGAGALYIAQFADWRDAYMVMAALIGFGAIGFVLAIEPPAPPPASGMAAWVKVAVIAPLTDFTHRHQWFAILVFVLLYKLATVLALSLTSPFYRDCGFSKDEVASVTKIFGLVATLSGGFIGAWIIARIGVWRCLFWGGVTQALALYFFCWLAEMSHAQSTLPDGIPPALVPHARAVLMLAVFSENISGAIAATAFGTYISALCNKQFTATQFALLTAMAALTGETLTSPMGYVATQLGWPLFFGIMPFAALPGMALLFYLKRDMKDVDRETTAD